MNGTADVFNGITIAGPSVEVKPNTEKLAQYGLTPATFQFQLQTQLEGSIVGNILEREQRTDIRMVYPKISTASLNEMKSQSIFLPEGKLKPITELASIEVKEGVAEIVRENIQSVIIVSARLNKRDLGSVMKDIQQKINTQFLLSSFMPNSICVAESGQNACHCNF